MSGPRNTVVRDFILIIVHRLYCTIQGSSGMIKRRLHAYFWSNLTSILLRLLLSIGDRLWVANLLAITQRSQVENDQESITRRIGVQ